MNDSSIEVQFNVRESRNLDEALRQITPKMENNILRTAIRAGGDIVRDAARQLAPVKSGLLKRDIKTVVRRGRPGLVVASVGVFAPAVKVGAKTKIFAFYAPFVEQGHLIVTRARHVRSLRTRRRVAQLVGGRVRPYPFLLPALVAKQAEVQRAVMEHIAKRLDELV